MGRGCGPRGNQKRRKYQEPGSSSSCICAFSVPARRRREIDAVLCGSVLKRLLISLCSRLSRGRRHRRRTSAWRQRTAIRRTGTHRGARARDSGCSTHTSAETSSRSDLRRPPAAAIPVPVSSAPSVHRGVAASARGRMRRQFRACRPCGDIAPTFRPNPPTGARSRTR